jgi:hypothetical protein
MNFMLLSDEFNFKYIIKNLPTSYSPLCINNLLTSKSIYTYE